MSIWISNKERNAGLSFSVRSYFLVRKNAVFIWFVAFYKRLVKKMKGNVCPIILYLIIGLYEKMMSCILLNPVLRANSITEEDSVSDMLKYLGCNTGNMVFVNAIKEQVSFVKEDWFRQDTEFSSHDVYVLPCSNFLHFSNRWIEPLTDIIEKHPIKIVLVGLGAQADLNESMDSVLRKLSEKQKRFFQITAERSTSIGVRGEFTAECLGKLGIKNCKIIGCPSAYKFLNGEFPYMKSPSFKKSIVTITPGRGRISSNIMQMAMRNNSDWIMQSKEEIIDNNVIKDKFYFPRIKRSELEKYRNARAIMFWNFKEWNKYIQNGNYTFAYGTRFHGNMMALRNEVPTLWFVHDMRTWELVNALKVPAMVKDKKIERLRRKNSLINVIILSSISAIGIMCNHM